MVVTGSITPAALWKTHSRMGQKWKERERETSQKTIEAFQREDDGLTRDDGSRDGGSVQILDMFWR